MSRSLGFGGFWVWAFGFKVLGSRLQGFGVLGSSWGS